MKELIDTATAADYLGVAEKTLANWRSLDTNLPAGTPRKGPRWIKVVGRVKYDRHDLDAWLDSHASEQPHAQAV